MKKIFLFCSLFLMLLTSAAFAAMPRDEMYVGGVGAGVTLGYVRSVCGEPMEVKHHRNEGIKSVVYVYSKAFRVTARVWARDEKPEDELVVTGFWLSDSSLATPSGITVGMSYEKDVESKFGPGREVMRGDFKYIYDEEPGVQFQFYVDEEDKDTIVAISQETDWTIVRGT